jgi:hypothetical protein
MSASTRSLLLGITLVEPSTPTGSLVIVRRAVAELANMLRPRQYATEAGVSPHV